MPFANMKLPAETLTADQKKHAVDVITDLYCELYGDKARPNVMVLIDEVPDGGWGIGG
jgi:4-oxalocrotonate tautomerase